MSALGNNFCFYCGTGPVHYLILNKSYYCEICKAEFKIDVVKDNQMTIEEAQAIFDNLPLTDKKAKEAAKRRNAIKAKAKKRV